ncbi:MAG: hypothetical protein J4A00_02225 [Gammaproteobacteria bacterium]|nr:hypothetical protein [Gammaproteobacteria bacterium]
MKRKWALVGVSLLLAAAAANAGKGGWITGDTDERFETVARHLRGLDMAMVEIGYRYQELYWGTVQKNWPYAEYQVAKIRQTLDNALQRRPKRAESAQNLFLPELERFTRRVAEQDDRAVAAGFRDLTASCNACHKAEGVGSFVVVPPELHRPAPFGMP